MLFFLAASAHAQFTRVDPGIDPYTRGDPEVMARAGYVGFGPFPLGSGHTTEDVRRLLPDEPLIWIETAHFRIGCSLPTVRIRRGEAWSKQWTLDVRRELKELHKVMPRVRTQIRELDPWLRAHLFALRLERLYAEVAGNLCFVPDRPLARGERLLATRLQPTGPHLGMAQKHVVLLLQRAASAARYTRSWFGGEQSEPVREIDVEFGCFYWIANIEVLNGLLASDPALHSHLVFNVAHNLYAGYRGLRGTLPSWLATGLAHRHARAVSERFPSYNRRDHRDHESRSAFWQWDRLVRDMALHGVFVPFEQFVQLPRVGERDVEQQIQAWAVVDYLATARPEQLYRFVHLVKEPGARQEQAIEEAFGAGIAELGAEWLAAARRRHK